MIEQRFSVEQHGRGQNKLVRRVVPKRGKEYEHRCPEALFRRVCDAVDDRLEPWPIQTLAQEMDEPHSAVNCAVAFLIEVGVVDRVGKIGCLLAEGMCAAIDGVTEYLALLEEPHADPEQWARNSAVLPIEVPRG